MNTNSSRNNVEKTKKWHDYFSSLIDSVLDIIILITSSALAVVSVLTLTSLASLIETDAMKCIISRGIYICTILLFVSIALKAFIWMKTRKTVRDYDRTRLAETLSEKAMNALKNVDAAKTRGILQSTYGRVSKWRPTDYCRNVLPYDVHEQLRTILIELQRLIIDTSEGLNDETVAVDLVYCYPDEKEHHSRCVNDGNERKWRIITNSTETHCSSIYSFIDSRSSFYESLQKDRIRSAVSELPADFPHRLCVFRDPASLAGL